MKIIADDEWFDWNTEKPKPNTLIQIVISNGITVEKVVVNKKGNIILYGTELSIESNSKAFLIKWKYE